jgi:hypothetical protein
MQSYMMQRGMVVSGPCTYSSIYADVLELPFYVPPRYAQTGADFAFKSGVQMAAVRAMIEAVSGI